MKNKINNKYYVMFRNFRFDTFFKNNKFQNNIIWLEVK